MTRPPSGSPDRRDDDPSPSGDEPPLSDDDRLLQRYLEGLTDAAETAEIELRLDEDDAFAARVDTYASLFEALDRAAAARAPAPARLVQEAVERWQAPPLRARTALIGFALTDLVLAGTLAAWAERHGPGDTLIRWGRFLADVAALAATASTSPAVPALLGVAAVAALVGLSGSSWAARGLLRRAGVLP